MSGWPDSIFASMDFKRYLPTLIVVLMALLFFVSTSSLNLLTQDPGFVKWSSPDETANYYFSRQYAADQRLAIFDRSHLITRNLAMPRSVRSDFGWIKPVSFLGIILIYGSLASFLGTAVIPYLTPFFAAAGIVLFFLIVRRLFSERVALWSAILLATFPVYIYYTARSMFHNVLFIVLCLAAVYLFLLALGSRREKEEKRFLSWKLEGRTWAEFAAALGAGLLGGLALITRSSEIIWLAPSALIVGIAYGRRLGLVKTVLIFSGLVFALLPVAYYNQILYGAFWYGGYNEMNRSLQEIAASGGELWRSGWPDWLNSARSYLGSIFANVFYFGFRREQSLRMLDYYVWQMFRGLSVAGLLGLVILVGQNIRRFQKRYLAYVLAWLMLGTILVFYYGSWQFNDNPDLSRHTIGNSYTRYWLPTYIGLMPLAALAITRITEVLLAARSAAAPRLRRYAAFGFQAAVVGLFASWSILFVLYGSEEGLSHLYYINRAERLNVEQVWDLTEPDAIIITRYYDKFLWPERKVIMGTLPNEEIFEAATEIVKHYPLYYYNFFLREADVDYLNERRLRQHSLRISLVRKIDPNFGLYKIEALPAEEAPGEGQVAP